MKRILTLLAAFLVMFATLGVSGSASAAPPEPNDKWTVRVAIDRTCLATVTSTWSGVEPGYIEVNRLYVTVVGASDLSTQQKGPIVLSPTARGKYVTTFQGWTRETKQTTRAWVGFSPYSAAFAEAFKDAACTWTAPS